MTTIFVCLKGPKEYNAVLRHKKIYIYQCLNSIEPGKTTFINYFGLFHPLLNMRKNIFAHTKLTFSRHSPSGAANLYYKSLLLFFTTASALQRSVASISLPTRAIIVLPPHSTSIRHILIITYCLFTDSRRRKVQRGDGPSFAASLRFRTRRADVR